MSYNLIEQALFVTILLKPVAASLVFEAALTQNLP